MTVADAIAQWLFDKGVTHAFGIVGSGNLSLFDAIARLGKTKIVATHHENINRLMRGTENKIGARVKPRSPEVGSGGSAVSGGRS